jgi:hypothetical protein
MKTYLILTTNDRYTKFQDSVKVSPGVGVGIYRRKLGCTTAKQVEQRMAEHKEHGHDEPEVMKFASDAEAKCFAREQQEFNRAQNGNEILV